MVSTTTTTTTALVGFENVTKGEVKNNEWVGVGIFDTLMYAANKNIEIQFNKGRIVGKEYAEAYTNVMNTIIAQAIQYYLQKDTQDAQTEDVKAATALKENQLIIDNSKLKAELEKQWGYTVSEDATTGKLTLADDSGGKIDKEIEDIKASTALKGQQKATHYTEQVKLDKEVAALRLDNVLKNVEAGRTSTDATEVAKWDVYTPKYVKS